MADFQVMEEVMGKRVVIYTRVSTAKQSDEGLSLKVQRRKLAAYAEVHDMEVVAYLEDAGKSAKNINGRPAFQEALDMLRRNQADGLLV